MAAKKDFVNTSLASFSAYIKGTGLFGLAFIGIGLFILIVNASGINPSAIGFGVFFIYLGATLAGLSVTGWFLRQTGKLIVEGLGGSIYEGEGGETKTASASGTLPGATQEKLIGSLTTRQYDAWIDANEPGLETWNEAGRPDFDSWLKKQ
jgi:hypothetical protein